MKAFKSALSFILLLFIEHSTHAVPFEVSVLRDLPPDDSTKSFHFERDLRRDADAVIDALHSEHYASRLVFYNRNAISSDPGIVRESRIDVHLGRNRSQADDFERRCIALQLKELATQVTTPGNGNLLRNRSIHDIQISTFDGSNQSFPPRGTAEVRANHTLVLNIGIARTSNNHQCAIVNSVDIIHALDSMPTPEPRQRVEDTRDSKPGLLNSGGKARPEPTRFQPAR